MHTSLSHQHMFKRTIRLCAYLLLAVLPLQGIAAANLLVCNSVMQVSSAVSIASGTTHSGMPCHETSNITQQKISTSDTQHSPAPICKFSCNAICASMSAFAPAQTQSAQAPHANLPTNTQFVQSFYVSITITSLQRPPITLS